MPSSAPLAKEAQFTSSGAGNDGFRGAFCRSYAPFSPQDAFQHCELTTISPLPLQTTFPHLKMPISLLLPRSASPASAISMAAGQAMESLVLREEQVARRTREKLLKRRKRTMRKNRRSPQEGAGENCQGRRVGRRSSTTRSYEVRPHSFHSSESSLIGLIPHLASSLLPSFQVSLFYPALAPGRTQSMDSDSVVTACWRSTFGARRARRGRKRRFTTECSRFETTSVRFPFLPVLFFRVLTRRRNRC
jgi:hypothetical protein